MAQQQTFFMIKPSAVKRGLKNDIFSRVEKAGLSIAGNKLINMTQEQARQLYQEHQGKPFYNGLVKMITSGSVICCILEGENAVERTREIMGATNPKEALAGTIRGDLKEENYINPDGIILNIVHGSDSADSASREIAIFFGDE
jgi:nucleoside-diphosphate kinase